MKKRLITGIAYIGVIVGFFFLRNIHPWFFGILVYAFSLIGTYEMVHAFSFRKAREDGSLEEPAFRMRSCLRPSIIWWNIFSRRRVFADF